MVRKSATVTIHNKSGFTLAEVLIALALLGIVAAFAIPKVLQSVGEQERKARFQDTYAALSEALYEGVLNKAVKHDTLVTYIGSRLNAVKVCTNAQTEGCYPGASTAPNIITTASGMVLPNGVMLFDMEIQPLGAYMDTFWVDVNGVRPPNQNCEDQFPLMMTYGNAAIYNLKAGSVVFLSSTSSIAAGIGVQNACPPEVFERLMN